MFQKIKIKHLNSLKENKGEYMGLLDIFKKSKKVDVTKVENNLKTVSQKTVSKQTEHRLDLTKKIDNSFKKLNLDKPEILSNALFLIDVSGSMDDLVDNMKKIDHLRDVMKNYQDARKICFSKKLYLMYSELSLKKK